MLYPKKADATMASKTLRLDATYFTLTAPSLPVRDYGFTLRSQPLRVFGPSDGANAVTQIGCGNG